MRIQVESRRGCRERFAETDNDQKKRAARDRQREPLEAGFPCVLPARNLEERLLRRLVVSSVLA